MQESPDTSLVRIRTADGRVVGAGFLVGERQILTCAHVISQALGLTDHASEPAQALVSLDFPLIPPRTLYTAKVVLWCPALADGRGDIAGLELQSDPPAAAEVVRFASAEDVWQHPFRAFGFPNGYDDGVWASGRLLGRQATDWVMIEDVKAQGFAVAPGFSGTPVWDSQLPVVRRGGHGRRLHALSGDESRLCSPARCVDCCLAAHRAHHPRAKTNCLSKATNKTSISICSVVAHSSNGI